MFFFLFFVFHHFLQDLGAQQETRSWQRHVCLVLLKVVDVSMLNPMTLRASTASGGNRQCAQFSSCPPGRSPAHQKIRETLGQSLRLHISFTWQPVDSLSLRSHIVLFLAHSVAKCVAMAPQLASTLSLAPRPAREAASGERLCWRHTNIPASVLFLTGRHRVPVFTAQ